MSISILILAMLTVMLHAATAGAQYLLARGGMGQAAVLYYIAIAGALACYTAVVRHVGERPSRRDWRLLIGVPLLIQIGWLVPLPVLAIDAYSYLVDAAHAHAGLNPYLHAVKDAGGTELGRALAGYGWRPVHGVSPYGPVWMNIISAVGPYATDIETGVRVVKVIAFAATCVAAWLLFRVAPEPFRVRALAAFWWNPAVIIEGAGEGHNDAVLVAASLLALWCLHRSAAVTSAAALTAAVLTKWIPVFFGPAYLVYAWRHRLLTARSMTAGALVVAAVTVVAYLPLWAGADTFAGIRTVSGPRFIASTTGSLVRVLGHYPTASALLRGCAAVALIAVVVYAAARTRTMTDLAWACAATALMYVFCAPMYWAWYVLLPIAFLAVAGDVPLILLLTATSRLVAPLDVMRLRGAFSWTTEVWLTTAIALWLPIVFVGWRIVAALLRDRRPVTQAWATSR